MKSIFFSKLDLSIYPSVPLKWCWWTFLWPFIGTLCHIDEHNPNSGITKCLPTRLCIGGGHFVTLKNKRPKLWIPVIWLNLDTHSLHLLQRQHYLCSLRFLVHHSWDASAPTSAYCILETWQWTTPKMVKSGLSSHFQNK